MKRTLLPITVFGLSSPLGPKASEGDRLSDPSLDNVTYFCLYVKENRPASSRRLQAAFLKRDVLSRQW
jgi:hypothetical protein